MNGVGIGLRPAHYGALFETLPRLGFVEVITENFLGLRNGSGGGRPLEILEQVRAHYPVALHGVSLNIGSVDPLRQGYLDRLARLVERIRPAVVSDHLCWTGVAGENLHDLLPLPATRQAVRHVVERVRRVQDRLGRRILLENVSSYVQVAHADLRECDFVAEVAEQADCGILLDVNNVYVSAANHGFDPVEYLERMPPGRVGQIHLAGHRDAGTHLVDTHDAPVPDAVWGLYAFAVARLGAVPTLIEWDDKLPSLQALCAEADSAAKIQEVVLEQLRATRCADGAGRTAAVDAVGADRSARPAGCAA